MPAYHQLTMCSLINKLKSTPDHQFTSASGEFVIKAMQMLIELFYVCYVTVTLSFVVFL